MHVKNVFGIKNWQKSVFQTSKLLFLKHFVKTECAKPCNRSPGANHENESACCEFGFHFLALHIFVRVSDFHLLDFFAAAFFCRTALTPSIGDGEVQQNK